MNYKHTQTGHLILIASISVVIPLIFLLSQPILDPATPIILFIVLLLLASFSTLNVSISSKHLQIKFGYGLFKKKFELKNISSVKTVKNHWYYGWGIRIWFCPFMRIYNVSGFDAVEIKMKNDKIYRIGTDEPKKLEFAILQSIKSI